MKKISYILLLCVCLTSCQKCKKDRHTLVAGYVIDSVTGKKVANAKVYLGIIESGTYGVSATTVEEKTSTSSGGFNFEFEAQQNKDYAVMAEANGYFVTESVNDFPISEGQQNINFNITLKPKATIKIHVKKTDMSYDSLVFSSSFGNGTGTYQSVFGKQVDTNLFYSHQVGGINKDIFIYVEKFSGQTLLSGTSYTHTAYLIPVDTTYINLNY